MPAASAKTFGRAWATGAGPPGDLFPHPALPLPPFRPPSRRAVACPSFPHHLIPSLYPANTQHPKSRSTTPHLYSISPLASSSNPLVRIKYIRRFSYCTLARTPYLHTTREGNATNGLRNPLVRSCHPLSCGGVGLRLFTPSVD